MKVSPSTSDTDSDCRPEAAAGRSVHSPSHLPIATRPILDILDMAEEADQGAASSYSFFPGTITDVGVSRANEHDAGGTVPETDRAPWVN